MESVCCSKNNPKPAPAPPQDSEGAVFDALCTVTDSGQSPTGRQTIPLDHHVYDNLSDTWHMKRSSPQPFMNVTIKIVPTDYTDLGFGPLCPYIDLPDPRHG